MTKGLKTEIFRVLGEVSMCWSTTPEGVFNSKKVKRIGNELIKEIEAEMKQNILSFVEKVEAAIKFEEKE